MAARAVRLCAVFLGGGTVFLGAGISYSGLAKYKRKGKIFFDESFCETSQDNEPHPREKARSLVKRVKEEKGCPGLAISVSLDGKTVWSEGFGYSDIENDVHCKPTTVMRIASISKPLTATAAMKLVEEGKLNLDDSVQKYVPSFPEKQVNSKACTITIRHLLSHLSGIRHYHVKSEENRKVETSESQEEKETDAKTEGKSEFDRPEYYSKEFYDSVEKSLALFKNDPLVHEPGSDYLYTTFGWTLLSAVIESASQQDFLKYMRGLFGKLGMTRTQAELRERLIYGRARFYFRDTKGRLKNTPYVDNSYKWAGGGFLSTTEDLIRFGNAMLYSSQVGDYQKTTKAKLLPGILSPESISLSWEIVQKTKREVGKKGGYGLGWAIFPKIHEHGCCTDQPKAVFHTGGAIGGSGVLLILPDSVDIEECSVKECVPPRGVVVAILVNMQSVQLLSTALEIAELFKNFKET